MYGDNLSQISVDFAIGVDPGFDLKKDVTAGKRIVELNRVTSDKFFETTTLDNVDMSFLDGLHLFEFLLRDIVNAEHISNPNGLILAHDCLPTNIEMTNRAPTPPAWTGDVWKVIPILEKWRPDLKLVLVDCHPTGLLCITNLDPTSTVVNDNYFQIVEEFHSMPNDEAALMSFYEGRTIHSAATVIDGQSRYFRN